MKAVDLHQLPPHQMQIVADVRDLARSLGVEVYLVGGPLRDLLLGRPVRDLDFTVVEKASHLAEALARKSGGEMKSFEAFKTFKVVLPDTTIDITTARSETYEHPGALPKVAS